MHGTAKVFLVTAASVLVGWYALDYLPQSLTSIDNDPSKNLKDGAVIGGLAGVAAVVLHHVIP
jgi:hypothetical protein